MKDENRTKAELVEELAELRQRTLQLEKTVVEGRRIEEILLQRDRELTLLNRASQVFISTHDLDQVLTTVLEEVRQLLGVVACSAWLVDPGTIDPETELGELVCRQVTDPQNEIVRGWRLAPGQGIAGWVVEHGKSLIVPDAWLDDRHFKGVDRQTGLSLRSILTVPLRVKEAIIGVIQVVDEEVNRFDLLDQNLLESLASVAAIAIENARLHEQTRQDAETKAMLLNEVNHRVKNNLTAIVGLLYTELNHKKLQGRPTCQAIIRDLINRIQGLATAHGLLSASEWRPLLLSDLAKRVIQAASQVLPPQKRVALNVKETTSIPIRITPKQSSSLALVLNELTTNTIKHSLTQQDISQISLQITLEGETIILEYRDDGPGYPDHVLQQIDHNVGLYLIKNIVCSDLRGEFKSYNDNGAVAIIRFKLMDPSTKR